MYIRRGSLEYGENAKAMSKFENFDALDCFEWVLVFICTLQGGESK